MRSPTLLPIRMNAAETSASSAMADWTPLTVVPRSFTTAEIDTFMIDVSTTRTNIAIASRIASRGFPSACSDAGAATASVTRPRPRAGSAERCCRSPLGRYPSTASDPRRGGAGQPSGAGARLLRVREVGVDRSLHASLGPCVANAIEEAVAHQHLANRRLDPGESKGDAGLCGELEDLAHLRRALRVHEVDALEVQHDAGDGRRRQGDLPDPVLERVGGCEEEAAV